MRANTGTKLIVGLLLAAVLAGGCDVTTKTPTPAPTASPSRTVAAIATALPTATAQAPARHAGVPLAAAQPCIQAVVALASTM